MKIPNYNKMRKILCVDVRNDYMSMSDEDVLYEYVKHFGSIVPLKEKE